MNSGLLLKVKEHILANPENFNMDCWHTDDENEDQLPIEECGTTACIAGWAVILKYGREAASIVDKATEFFGLGNDFWEERAQKALGLQPEQTWLFYDWRWPSQVEKMKREIPRKTELVGQLIDFFVEAKGDKETVEDLIVEWLESNANKSG